MGGTGHEPTPLADARRRLRELCQPHGRTDSVAVTDADGRILAESIEAIRTVPHYDRAAMDGFAVRAGDTAGASTASPVRLDIVDDRVGTGEAVQVHTGSPLPEGADAVVRVERTERDGSQLGVQDAVPVGKDVAPAGEDVEAGEKLFERGRHLRPSDLSLLSATGYRTVEVADLPRISVVPTGEELVPVGEDPAVGEVVETNGPMVRRLAERWGGSVTARDIVGDDPDALREAIERDCDHDIVVTTGGSSVGDRDHIADVVANAGEVVTHGVAIKPGHPVGFGVVEDTPVLLLPGYPVSCLITAVQFLRPAIAWRAGSEPVAHPTVRARLGEPLESRSGKRSFERVTLDRLSAGGSGDQSETLPEARPVEKSGASVISSVTAADGWVEIAESQETVPAGEIVDVQQWE